MGDPSTISVSFCLVRTPQTHANTLRVLWDHSNQRTRSDLPLRATTVTTRAITVWLTLMKQFWLSSSIVGLKWCHFRLLLLVVGLIGCSHGFHFVHSRVEVLDVLRRVETRGAVVLVGHHFGAKASEGQSTPVVGRADVFHLLEKENQRFPESPDKRRWAQVFVTQLAHGLKHATLVVQTWCSGSHSFWRLQMNSYLDFFFF